MKNGYAWLISIAIISLVTFGLQACSIKDNILPNAEFNTLLVEADVALQEGRWNDAINKLERAAMLQPKNLNVKLKQGRVYQQSGKLALAHNAYQQIIDTDPNPSGENVEIVATAKASQAKLGFGGALQAEAEASAPPKVPELKGIESADVAVLGKAAENVKARSNDIVVKELVQEEKPVAQTSDVESINLQIEAWRTAWQDKRISDYLSFYVQNFSGDFSSHTAWRKQRTRKLNATGDMSILISTLKVELQGSTAAVATFTQSFQSANYADVGLKTLHLQKINKQWLISREQFQKQ